MTPKSRGNRILYAMEVAEVLPYDRYFRDTRFSTKKPDYAQPGALHKCGDNIYRPGRDGRYTQLRSMHSDGLSEDPVRKAHDLSGTNALISRRFWYFGSQATELPAGIGIPVPSRGHRKTSAAEVAKRFELFIEGFSQGVTGSPHSWPTDDGSWEKERSMRHHPEPQRI